MSHPIKPYLGQSALFELTVIDAPDAIEHRMLYNFCLLQKEWAGKAGADITSSLFERHSKGRSFYEDTLMGLLYSILATTDSRHTFFTYAQSIITDDWIFVVEQLKYFTYTKFLILKDEVRDNLSWLLDRLISLHVKGCDGLLIGMLRQLSGGKTQLENAELLRNILELIDRHRVWLFDQPAVVPYVVYVLLRCLSERGSSRELLCSLSVELLTKRYKECSLLGRDLVRCLMEVSQMPEMAALWKWLITRDDSTGVSPVVILLMTPTPRKYLMMRLTPSMEIDLKFILDQVASEKQAYYFRLFLDVHCNGGESDQNYALIADIIRYIVVSFHPPNSVLASNIVQRWAIVLLLLRSLRTSFGAVSCKLALLLDWYFFRPEMDSVMVIEVGILLIYKCMASDPNVSATLIEFLYLMVCNFYPPLAEHMSKSTTAALQLCIEKKVIPSIEAICNSPMLPRDIQAIASKLFKGDFVANSAAS